MSERLKDLIAYIVAVGVLLVTKLRPHAATADAVGTETIPPLQGR
jgi:hypothetical protein